MTESYVQIKNQESCETNRNRYNTMCDDDRKEILREENGEQYTGAVDLRFTRIEMPCPPSRSYHIARSVIDNISGGDVKWSVILVDRLAPEIIFMSTHIYWYTAASVVRLWN